LVLLLLLPLRSTCRHRCCSWGRAAMACSTGVDGGHRRAPGSRPRALRGAVLPGTRKSRRNCTCHSAGWTWATAGCSTSAYPGPDLQDQAVHTSWRVAARPPPALPARRQRPTLIATSMSSSAAHCAKSLTRHATQPSHRACYAALPPACPPGPGSHGARPESKPSCTLPSCGGQPLWAP
jgi:hypothetical protein